MGDTIKFKKTPIIFIIILLLLCIYLGLRLFFHIAFSPVNSKIDVTTKQQDHFVLRECNSSFLQRNYYYEIFEKINDREIPVINGHFTSTDEEFNGNDIFNNFTEYKYNGKIVRVYTDKYNFRMIFKIQSYPNYIYGSRREILELYRNNNLPDYYNYLIPMYVDHLKSSDKKQVKLAIASLIVFDSSKSFNSIIENIKKIDNKEIENSVLVYIKNYPKSEKTKYELIGKLLN
ncbi:hypothetical protein FDJ70_10720 [Clostridium botulinum]|uniref:Uncharacterized protein n=1 Tax=Clostridium botulinum D str. 1873 TaxID=592027 RepID=A0A9N7AL43_CLOBO|nr:hypothetical protein [Clostridium botulinum]ACT33696.1 conserved hypothetical protein [Clostridium botulinum D str. 1873]NFV48122.1 hypothetical protein [Clostridium botulinum]